MATDRTVPLDKIKPGHRKDREKRDDFFCRGLIAALQLLIEEVRK